MGSRDDLSKLLAAQSIFLFYPFFKVTFFTKLGDNVAGLINGECLVKFDDVGMFDFIENVNLLVDKRLEMFGLKFIKFDNFYGDCLFLISKGILVLVLSAL